MSGFDLLAPLGLTALIGVPLVILFHMRHTTPRRYPVPTLRFWLVAIREQQEEARFRRPPLSLLLLLHLLIVGAIGFALARPVTSSALAGLGQRTEPRHLILLLDGSTSMTARDASGGQTRYEAARDEAIERLDDLREGDVATVLVLGTHLTTREATDAAGLKALRDQLGRLPAPGGRADLNAALGLAKDLILPDLDDQIILISDGKLTADPGIVVAVGAPIDLVTVGDPASPNVAITDLSTRASAANPAERELYAQITNFSDQPVTAPYEVLGGVVSIETGQETIEPGASAELVTSVPAGATDVTVTVNHPDAQPADNQASAVLAKDDDLALRILLVSDAPMTMQRVLSVLPGAQVTVEGTDSPAAEHAGGNYDLVVYESWTPSASGLPAAPVLFIHPPGGGLFEMDGGVLDAAAAETIRAEDPMLFGVELAGIRFGETPAHVLGPSDVAVVATAEGPLIYRGTAPGTNQPMVVLAFDVGQSNMPERPAFPILMANIANDLAPSPLPSSVPLGEPLVYRPSAGAAVVRFVPPAGEPIDLRVGAGEPATGTEAATSAESPAREPLRDVAYADTGLSGEYGVVELGADEKEIGSGRFIVNAGSDWESDLRTNPDLPDILGTAQAGDEVGFGSTLSDLWPALVAAALALLALEWLVTVVPWRRRRRRRRAPPTGRAAHG
ncbi:MAG: BatA domain-containing protein [Thermomicrobiales bacterium]